MKIGNCLMASIVIAIIFSRAASVFAQNMEHTVVTKEVKFARGKNQATLRGSAKYGMSYAFELRAKEGQTMDLSLVGKNSQLAFSLEAPPDDDTMENGFLVTKWSGKLPKSGRYSIVVVMNDEHSTSVPFTLEIKIR